MYECIQRDRFIPIDDFTKQTKKIHNRSEGKKVICECVCIWKLQKLSLIKNRKQNYPNEDKKQTFISIVSGV